jgi:hypothetical protein
MPPDDDGDQLSVDDGAPATAATNLPWTATSFL